ncbi:glutamic acid-rich protein-like [Odontomachus brunneus]|uniref:glutamic acid-rich protein-like n=1 Tax=Odontomachus brunneus TaxID=486640 RepID=UPI0013F1ABDE|nr:glutamic acid-rich protein-like [Odontomachus brunneus]
MKTKSAHKKGKKRPLREPSLSSKSDKKLENVVKIKKSKKAKIDNTVQNGSPVAKTEMQVLRKMNKQQKKQKEVKEQGNIRKLSKAKIKTNVTEQTKQTAVEFKEKTLKAKEKKLEQLKNKQLIREVNKVLPRKSPRYKAPQNPLDLEQLISKVAEIRNREVLSKTAKKRVAVLLRKIRVAQAEKSNKSETVENEKKNKQQANVSAKNKKKANVKNKRKAKRELGKNKKVRIDNNEYDEDQSDMEVEEEEEIEDEEDGDEEDNEKTAIVEVKKKMKKTADRPSDVPKKKETKNKRYVLSVSNLPYDITSNELKQHFLSKVDAVTSVNIQTKPSTKKSRGFAYVELSNSADYEKALSLNHTFLKKKKINVQYTMSKNVSEVDAKNKKLGMLRKFADVKEKKKLSKKGKQKSKGSKA